MSIKNIIRIVVLLIMTITILSALFFFSKVKKLETELNVASLNLKAYANEQDSIKSIYSLTISQLNYNKDSISKKLVEVQKLLKIKDNKIQSLQYLETQFNKIDSIILRDTIFKENYSLDTLLLNEWYKLEVSLKYPNMIKISPSIKDEIYIITANKKETVKPPHKFFLFRWFQKKHTVVTVQVYNKNPYVKIGNTRFVNIIK